MRECEWHYGDCLLQRAHYRMRRLPHAERRQLRRLEKVLDDWGQEDADKCNYNFASTYAHLECGEAIDGVVWTYLHPTRHATESSALQQKLHKYIASLEAAEGPITHPYRHDREKADDPDAQADMDQAIEKLRKATLRLRQETKWLHGRAADYVAAYVPDIFGGRE
jgi:hypothetical protein